MKARLPVARHLGRRSGRGLIFRTPSRLRELLAGEHFASPIVVKPGLSRFKAGRNWMARGMEMFRGVLTGRTVATADMPAFTATPQMQPPSACCKALGAALAARRHIWIDSMVFSFQGLSPTAAVIFYWRCPLQTRHAPPQRREEAICFQSGWSVYRPARPQPCAPDS